MTIQTPVRAPAQSLFPPTRAAALERLAAFVPQAGRAYAEWRNTDSGPGAASAVSRLSPYIRHRLLAEEEVVSAVLARHSLQAAEKYVQEVLWRTYWKGWLEMRPQVWTRYLAQREADQAALRNPIMLAAAQSGATGIEGFDDWARELLATGYLHNHARMWFASIWIFTLRLPWTLGADFFLRHLLDADAASNTLSWRWVAGLQTPGKTYLATADNIARYTKGRFAPAGLATEAEALTEEPLGKPQALPRRETPDPDAPALLLVTPEDMWPEWLSRSETNGGRPTFAGALVVDDDTLVWGSRARRFAVDAATDCARAIAADAGLAVEQAARLDAATLLAAARAAGARQIVTPYAPIGQVAAALERLAPALAAEGIALRRPRRAWDETFWPHATKGFFPFKERIPEGLRALGIG
ncbi:FAD-binding domain-containing protein [Alteraurantiacibacter palmitatis]|uniref:FAD-binding domain-containing protein n=1 Tax=Alteraurantiacibacter palmitatis TaxID=2054628 RepID=A0ABV7EA96_9SPHN